MKKLLIFLLSLALLLSAAACGEQNTDSIPEFKDLGAYTADNAKISVSGDKAIFSFISNTRYASHATLVLYDLLTDSTLGTLDGISGEDDVFFTDSGL